MSTPLYRPEALGHQRDRLFGEALIIWPVGFKVLALGAALVAIVFIVFVTWGEYTRKVRVTGYLVPSGGFVKVYVRDSATIKERRVNEGNTVKKGDVLFLLSLDRSGSSGVGAGQIAAVETTRRREALLGEKAKLAAIGRSQTYQIEQRIAALSDEHTKIDREIELQQKRVETFRKATERFKQLVAENFVSANQLQQQTGLQLEQELLLSSLERSKLAIWREILGAKRQLPEINMRSQNDVSAIDRQLSALTQDLADVDARRELVVLAPADGIVTAIQAELGQLATPAFPLLSVIPVDAIFEARLLAPASAIGFIKPGKGVNLRYAAYPYQRFGHQRGTVSQIARTTVTPNELASPLVQQEAIYVVTVALAEQDVKAYGERHALQAGMTLEADVLLDARPIYQWVLEPLFSIKGRI